MKKTFLSLVLFSSLMTLAGCFKGCSKDKKHEEQSLDKKEKTNNTQEDKNEKNKAEIGIIEKNNTDIKDIEKTNSIDERTSEEQPDALSFPKSTSMVYETMGPDDFLFQEEGKLEKDFGYDEPNFGYNEPRSRFEGKLEKDFEYGNPRSRFI